MSLWWLAFKNGTRNPTRTALTLMTIVLGTALLTVSLAWLRGIFEDTLGRASEPMGHVRIVDPGFAERERLFPLDVHVTDSVALAESLSAIDGVESVVERTMSPVTVSSGDTIGEEYAMLIGASRSWWTQRARLDEALVEGDLLGPKDGLVVGARVARRAGVGVGDELILIGRTQDGAISPLRGPVIGIVQSGGALVDGSVFIDIDRMRYVADIEGTTEILIYAEDRDDNVALAGRIEASGLAGPHLVQAWSQREPWGTLIDMSVMIWRWMTAIIVFVTALGVWNTMMMSVLERQSEIGILRAMGLTRLGVVALFVGEALCISVLGGAIGVALGGGMALYLEQNGITLATEVTQNMDIPIATTLYADLTLTLCVQSFVLGGVMAVLGSAPPALRAASIPPVEAIRRN